MKKLIAIILTIVLTLGLFTSVAKAETDAEAETEEEHVPDNTEGVVNYIETYKIHDGNIYQSWEINFEGVMEASTKFADKYKTAKSCFKAYKKKLVKLQKAIKDVDPDNITYKDLDKCIKYYIQTRWCSLFYYNGTCLNSLIAFYMETHELPETKIESMIKTYNKYLGEFYQDNETYVKVIKILEKYCTGTIPYNESGQILYYVNDETYNPSTGEGN